MTVLGICPSCGATIELARGAEEGCLRCGAPLPTQLLSAARAAEERRRPLLLTLLMVLGFFTGLPMLLLFALFVIVPGSWAKYHGLHGEQVTKGAFLVQSLPAWLMMLLLLAASYALWKELWWGRHVLGAILIEFGLVFWLSSMAPLSFQAPFWAVILLLLAYLYLKPSVVHYYRELSIRRTDLPL